MNTSENDSTYNNFSQNIEIQPISVDLKRLSRYKPKNKWKFYLIPGYHDEYLDKVEFEVNRTRNKRFFFGKLLNPLTILGIVLLLIMGTFAVFPHWFTHFTVEDLSISTWKGSFEAPGFIDELGRNHLLGTSEYGRDVYGRLIWGARTSLTVGLQSLFISVVFGIILGTISAYFGGIVDMIIMRIFDVIMCLPSIIVVLVITSLIGQTIDNILVIIGIMGISGYARFMRASVLEVKESLYIQAARTSGADNFKIMFKYIVPNAISPMIIQISYALGGIVLMLSGIAYLNFGDAEMIDWGMDINIGRSRLFSAPWTLLYPGLFIGILVLAFIILGDGLRDALNPKLNK
jgi:peptide/nickel transport system permease protein